MFDFAADARDEGGVVGRNNKGLVTYDRKLKKDAFYLYKAYWTTEPMVYVAGRRFADRAPEERDITVYTNCDEVTLVVNGVEVATKAAVDHAVVFENVALNDGENTITAKSSDVEDTISLNGVAEHNADYTLPDIAAAMAVGNWFDDIADNDDSDEIEVIDGYYSVEDPLKVLLVNEECVKCVKGWLMSKGNLTMVSTLMGSLFDVMGDYKITMFTDTNLLVGTTQKEFAKLNRQLNKIPK
mgnify:CR=1 FL=1